MSEKLQKLAEELKSEETKVYQKIQENKWILFVDKFIYLTAFVGFILTIPQIYRVWVLRQAGMTSLLISAFFAGISLAWLVYGIAHKKRAIVVTNFGWVALNTFLVVGAEMFR
jgi:hypothetical protein